MTDGRENRPEARTVVALQRDQRAEKKALKSDKNYELTESDLDESDTAEMSEPSEILMVFFALLALIVSGKVAKIVRARSRN